MKILAFTDIHGKLSYIETIKKKLADVDLLICSGDLTIFEEKLDHLLVKLNSFNKIIFIVNGNHEGEKRLKEFTTKFKNIFFLHKEIINYEDIFFVGYGGGGFSQRDDDFEEFVKKNENKIKDKNIVLVTHAPPYNTKLDIVVREHVGNKSYYDFIKKYKPLAHFCGHLHENFSRLEKIGETIIVNPGPEGMIIEV
ncbi:MAG: metallophosphoesterase [Candidatus Woesearchaeota archaeon]